MNATVATAVLFAALLHASWNALVKAGGSTLHSTALVAGGSAAMSALLLPFCTMPAPESWPFIAVSSLIQAVYYGMLAATYSGGEVSFAYPLMRGTAPMLVALVSLPLLGERLHPLQWAAIGCICGGILSLCVQEHNAGRGSRRTAILALATACLIASYTIVDGLGVRRSGSALGYTLWIFLLSGGAFFVAAARRGSAQLLALANARPRILFLGGTGSLLSYGIALWAMTRAPVATVAALRETSILFATIIAAFFLREKVNRRRVAAVLLVASGATLMRLG